MGSATLVEGKINNGKKLVEILDSKDLKFPVALWMKVDEDNWTLVFGVQDLEKQSRKTLLGKIYQIIRENDIFLSLDDVELIDNKSSRISSLKMMITTSSQLTEISFFGNFINGHKFPDSIIYRVN